LTTAATASTWIYYTVNSVIQTSSSTDSGTWNNWGSVTVQSSVGNGAVYINSAGNLFTINNWGNWTATDASTYLKFYQITFNHYGGNFFSTWYSTSQPTIVFDNSFFYFKPGSENGGFWGPVYFTSDYNNYYNGIASSPPVVVEIDTTGLTISNAWFYGVNIVVNNNVTISNSNFTTYATLNSTQSGIGVTFDGTVQATSLLIVSLTGTTPGPIFTISTAHLSTFELDGTLGLFGNVQVLTFGNTTLTSATTIYQDAQTYWVNFGNLDVSNGNSFSIYGSSFTSSTTSNIGTFVNKGTVNVYQSSDISYEPQNDGTFLQCKDGVIKLAYGYPSVGDAPGYISLSQLSLDGYIGVYIDNSYPFSNEYPLYWDASYYATASDKIWTGTLDVFSYTQGNLFPIYEVFCYDTSSASYGYLYLKPLSTSICTTTTSKGYFGSSVACSGLDADIPGFDNYVTYCPVGAECGLPTGVPLFASTSSGSFLSASLALVVSLLVCLYLQF